MPRQWIKRRFVCRACGHRWERDAPRLWLATALATCPRCRRWTGVPEEEG